MKKTILFLSYYFEPEFSSDRFSNRELCEALVEQGFLVRVITNTPSHGMTGTLRKRYKKRDKRHETLSGGSLIIHRVRTVAENGGNIKRIFRFLQYIIKAFFLSLFFRSDAICMGSTPPLLSGLVAVMLKKLKKNRMVMRLQDIFPDNLVDSGLLHSSFLTLLFEGLEKFIYRHSDALVVQSEDMRRNVLAKGVTTGKIHIIPDWVDLACVSQVPFEENVFARELDLAPQGFYPLFAGNIGAAQNLDVIIRAAEILSEYPEITFLIVGGGSAQGKAAALAEDRCLSNIRFVNMQPASRLSEVYSAGSVGLVTLGRGLIYSACPIKTYAIMGCSRPVVASVDIDSGYAKMINTQGIGFAVDADDSEALAGKLLELYQNREIITEQGSNAREYLEANFSRDICTKKYCDLFCQGVIT